jgi:hypothetical protein
MDSAATYDRLIEDLRQSYDRMAEERERKPLPAWKIEDRQRFLSLLHEEGKSSLLEIGAGPGAHSKFFRIAGWRSPAQTYHPEAWSYAEGRAWPPTSWTS